MSQIKIILVFLLFISLFQTSFSQTILKEKIKSSKVKQLTITSCLEEDNVKEVYMFNGSGDYTSIIKERNGDTTDIYNFFYQDTLLIEVKVKMKRGSNTFQEGRKTFEYDQEGRILKNEMKMGEHYVLSQYKYLNDSTEMNHTIVDDGEFAFEEYIETVRSKYHNLVSQRTIEDDYVRETREQETIKENGMEKIITKVDGEITRTYIEFLDENENPFRIEDEFPDGISKSDLIFNDKGLPIKETILRKVHETLQETHQCLLYEYEYSE